MLDEIYIELEVRVKHLVVLEVFSRARISKEQRDVKVVLVKLQLTGEIYGLINFWKVANDCEGLVVNYPKN